MTIDRRELLQWAAAGLALAGCGGSRHVDGVSAPGVPHRWLEEVTIEELGRMMASGERTSRAICEAYLARIEQLDRGEAGLGSVIEVNPDALAIADSLDAERKAGKVRGPLHGIPVLVKDNLDTADRMQTTAGSLALVGARPARDSTVVARLRAAGAVLLGKTNLSEWANIRSTRSSSGWSARGGQTRNPYALDRSPCGSSAGSGAAVAANLCAVAIGTETDGSIICPSSMCNLVGIKPTIGLVSRAGIVPIAHTQDTAGPMARTVADAAIVLAAIAGADERDAQTAGAKLDDYVAALRRDARGMKIGVVRADFGTHPEQDSLCEAAIRALAARGVTVVDPVELPKLPSDDTELTVLLYELKADLNAYLATANAKVKTLADVIAFNNAHAREEMPYFGQELFEQAEAKGPLTDEAYTKALAAYDTLRAGVEAVMTKHGLDALVSPSTSPPWLIDYVLGDHFAGSSTTTAAVTGFPSITVPVGFTRGLPIGLSLYGRAYSEATLLALAAALEAAVHARQPPALSRSADLNAVSTCGESCAKPGR